MVQDAEEHRSAAPTERGGAATAGPRPPRARAGRGGVALVALLVLALAIGLGPRPRVQDRWVEPTLGADVDGYLATREGAVEGLLPDEAASVSWADTVTRTRTPLAVVYLHGFSADRHEIEPLVSDLAGALGANAFFARLTGHAVGGTALAEATEEDWLADAAEAVAIGGTIGERVVLVGTSTGATLALWAAARAEAADRVAALVLISPNLGLRDPSARVLTWPWGGLVARWVVGPERCFEPANDAQARHWTVCYPTRALLPMAALVRHVRGLDLAHVRVPTLAVYSREDQVVDPTATEEVLARLHDGRGPATLLVRRTGDPARHVVAGAIMSPATTEEIGSAILDFLLGADVR